MWLLRIFLFVILLVAAIWVSVDNSDQLVDVHLFGKDFAQIHLYLVMFGAAAVGFLAGLLISAVREVRLRMRLSQERKSRALLEREVSDLRAAPVQGLTTGSHEVPSLPTRTPE